MVNEKRSNNTFPLLLIFQHDNYHKCYKIIVNHIPNLVRVIIYIALNLFFFAMVKVGGTYMVTLHD